MLMQTLTNRQILLGLSGGIAAYKSADLARRLREAGALVRVVMTAAATEFITPMTMQAVSGNTVHTELLDAKAEAAMGHIELARWADLVLVAPATADFIARLSQGQADDLLSTLCLACDAPRVLAPSMNQAMWHDQATQDNCQCLLNRGVRILGPTSGSQACGDIGLGRMLEPVDIVAAISAQFESRLLEGLSVLVTAGPTREALDPVRFLSNHSSGKMGFALAEAAAAAGARTTLVTGPVSLSTPARVERLDVETAADMYREVLARSSQADIVIAAAAVADYRPENVAPQKLKKAGEQEMTLRLVRNPDIVAAVAQGTPKPFTVGFAAETTQLIEHARGKLASKSLDMIIANDVSVDEIGFNSDYNAVTVLYKGGCEELAMSSKHRLAMRLIELIASRRGQAGVSTTRGNQ